MRWLASTMLTACAALTAYAVPGDPAKKELDSVQGVWQIVSMELDGIAFPEETAKSFKLTVKGDKASHSTPDGKSEEATIKLDPSKKPKAIDLTPLSGEDKGKTYPGIYVLEGDTWKICASKGGTRPTEFRGGKDIALITLKREKK